MVREVDSSNSSLQTGALISLWISVISGAYIAITSLRVFSLLHMDDDERSTDPHHKRIVKINRLVSMISAIVGLITAILGINAIQKNKAKYLTPVLCYYGLIVVYGALFMLVAFFNPKLYIMTTILVLSSFENYALIGPLEYIIELGLIAYFFVVIKSCRNSMWRKAAGDNVNLGNDSSYTLPSYCKA